MMFDRPLPTTPPPTRSSLVLKAMVLFLAISALLAAEVILGQQLGKRMEQAADDLQALAVGFGLRPGGLPVYVLGGEVLQHRIAPRGAR